MRRIARVIFVALAALSPLAFTGCMPQLSGTAAAVETARPLSVAREVDQLKLAAVDVAARAVTREPEAVQTPVSLSVPDLVEMIRPGVVHIANEQVAIDLLGREVPSQGVGTGFIVDKQGHVVTNDHVVAGARRILVTLWDGRDVEATVVGRDPQTDVAVLKIATSDLPVVNLGQSSKLRVGEQVVAIGHALDLPGGPTVTAGVVSALERAITNAEGAGTLSDLIQSDASINPGNSGGPLLNMRGEVVGINVAGIVGSENVGFAISIDGAKPIIAELINRGVVQRGFLGIVTATITRSIARQNGLPVDSGVFILNVGLNTPASAVGLMRGDIIVEIAGVAVKDSGDLSRILVQHKPGSKVTVKFYRGDAQSARSVEVVLAERPAD